MKGAIAIAIEGDNEATIWKDAKDKGVIFKKLCLIHWYHNRNKQSQIDNMKYLDIVMPMYSLKEYKDS